MSTVTLRYLEEKLNRETPALRWHCEPGTTGNLLEGTNLPEEIQVRATRGGIPIKENPFYLSGECLIRWGLDASASMICNEYAPHMATANPRPGLDWDRLAEF
jgi:hypothetical protein